MADTSAVHLILRDPANDLGWNDTVATGIVGLGDITELEVMRSAMSTGHGTRLRTVLRDVFPWVPTPDGVYQRALEVQQLLIRHGEHRGAGPIDLLIAATAELSDLTLLHCDKDILAIAKHTQQPTEYIHRSG
nr:PIN domain nuclease [Streptomyces coryli]